MTEEFSSYLQLLPFVMIGSLTYLVVHFIRKYLKSRRLGALNRPGR